MMTRPLLKLLLGALSLLACCELGYAQELPTTAPLVVVELFQSQGCSSCPPAEANLNAIAGQPGILALSYGVTYWDSIGWKDTFAKQAYTERQWAYARHHRHGNVWTPQVYVNGHSDLVGSDRAQLDQVIADATTAQGPPLSWEHGQLVVGAGKPAADCDVWLVRYDPRTINVAIGGGENGGRTLPHRNVVRELVHLGNWDGSPHSFAVPPSSFRGLSTAALVQIKAGGDILSASRDSAAL
ncbi:DUF1223 domain-containing protein [Rhodanobacter sp. C03]|uniref:DUF1223 domain-containing protein n=1 Tax=Rhodanobacter sp. C03 TaxID=1945858 RepID=UPI001C2C7938|nr:DUF1223 domain-containing protein [Rhodanobacter sp. C03]